MLDFVRASTRRVACGFRSPVVAALLASVTALHAAEPEYVSARRVAPGSASEIERPLERLFPVAPGRTALFPRLRSRLDTLPPFVRDSVLTLTPRLYNFDRERSDAADQVTFAAGGALDYRSGLWQKRARLGLTAYTAQKLHGPSEAGGSGMLVPSQTGFGVLGQAYLEIDFAPLAMLRLHRQEMNLPYLNGDDTRMVPLTQEAYLIGRPQPGPLQWVAGHVTRMKPKDSESFMPLSEAAGFADTNEGLSLAGARWAFGETINLTALNLVSWDFMNIAYAEGTLLRHPHPEVDALYAVQGTWQRSIGQELGGEFETYQLGARVSLSYRGAMLSFASSYTGEDAAIQSPYGGVPSYLSSMLFNFDGAGEYAWLTALSYQLGRYGLPGVGVNVRYARGYSASSAPDRDELDLTVDVKPEWRPLHGLWFRFRTATTLADDSLPRDDVRFIVNYEIDLL